jgi:hypothetical protein
MADPEPPAGASEMLRVRIDADGVCGIGHQGPEPWHKRAINVVGDDDQVGPFGLNKPDEPFH